MQSLRKTSLTVACFGALVLAGGVVATVAFGATGNGKGHGKKTHASLKASTTGTTAGPFKSNEDATHEAEESAAVEAQEDSGQRPHHGDGGPFRPNEDATHESGESAAREAAEDAARTGTTTTP